MWMFRAADVFTEEAVIPHRYGYQLFIMLDLLKYNYLFIGHLMISPLENGNLLPLLMHSVISFDIVKAIIIRYVSNIYGSINVIV